MTTCPICSSKTKIKTIFKQLPVSSAMLEHQPSNDIGSAVYQAAICENCGHISNASPSRFETAYNDQRYVVKRAVGSAMSTNLQNIIDFIAPSNINGLSILEIASGSGEIADWMADMGADVDTVDPAVSGYENTKINHSQAMFDNNFNPTKQYDLIIARHIIEHTEDPGNFLTLCYTRLKDTGVLYIECPDLANTLETRRLVDFFNDHIQYFTKNSLRTLARKRGLEEIDSQNWLNGAHMGMLFSKRNITIETMLIRSEAKFKNVIYEVSKAESIAIYGAGAHACTFASQLNTGLRSKVKYVFDKSSDKQGRYIPGIAAQIMFPELTDVDLIINTSSLYASEVEQYLINLGYQCSIINL